MARRGEPLVTIVYEARDDYERPETSFRFQPKVIDS